MGGWFLAGPPLRGGSSSQTDRRQLTSPHAGDPARSPVRNPGSAAGMLGMVLFLILGCRIDPRLPETAGEAVGAKAITAFSFPAFSATGAIDESAKGITATVPHGTDLTALVAAFTTTGVSVKVGSVMQASGTTANNFSQPVTYVVKAKDGSTASYTVTVAVAPPPVSSAKAITVFLFVNPVYSEGTIDEAAKTIHVAMPYGTNVNSLVASFLTTGSSVKVGSTLQQSGVTANDFSNPVTYTVIAADGSWMPYAVTVGVAPGPSSAQITRFGLTDATWEGGPAGGWIDESAKTITVFTDLGGYPPPFLGPGPSIAVAAFAIVGARVVVGSTVQVSGETQNDFTSPVIYTVIAQDGTTVSYTVYVTSAIPCNPNGCDGLGLGVFAQEIGGTCICNSYYY